MKADGKMKKDSRSLRVIGYLSRANAKLLTNEIIPFFAFAVKKKTVETSRLELVQTINFSRRWLNLLCHITKQRSQQERP